MDNVAREKLVEIVRRFGPEICGDARRCEALLRDMCGEHRREIAVLVTAIREQVTAELRAPIASVPRETIIERCAHRLRNHAGVSPHLARWSVESWALALGVIAQADIAHLFQCPLCGATGSSKTPIAGKSIRCPRCQSRIRVSVDERDFIVETKTARDATSPAPANDDPMGVEDPAADPFAPERCQGHEQLRVALRRIMADGVITQYERLEVQRLRESLGVSSDLARQIFTEVKGELLSKKGTRAETRRLQPAPASERPFPISQPATSPAPRMGTPPRVPPPPRVSQPPDANPPRVAQAPPAVTMPAGAATPEFTGSSPFAITTDQRGTRAMHMKLPSGAATAVRGPAIGLLMTGILGGCSCLYSAFNIITSPREQGNDIEPIYSVIFLLAVLAFFMLNCFICLASVQMLKLKAFRQAIAASILAMVPCIGCCVLGIPIGAWSLVVLMRDDVRGSFHG